MDRDETANKYFAKRHQGRKRKCSGHLETVGTEKSANSEKLTSFGDIFPRKIRKYNKR